MSRRDSAAGVRPTSHRGEPIKSKAAPGAKKSAKIDPDGEESGKRRSKKQKIVLPWHLISSLSWPQLVCVSPVVFATQTS